MMPFQSSCRYAVEEIRGENAISNQKQDSHNRHFHRH